MLFPFAHALDRKAIELPATPIRPTGKRGGDFGLVFSYFARRGNIRRSDDGNRLIFFALHRYGCTCLQIEPDDFRSNFREPPNVMGGVGLPCQRVKGKLNSAGQPP